MSILTKNVTVKKGFDKKCILMKNVRIKKKLE